MYENLFTSNIFFIIALAQFYRLKFIDTNIFRFQQRNLPAEGEPPISTWAPNYSLPEETKVDDLVKQEKLETTTISGEHARNPKMCSKSIQCSQCLKSFSRPCRLRDHMMIHMGEKPYSCSECSKSFSTPDGLKTHFRTHTGEKPYRCSYCSKSFYSSSSWKLHLRTHDIR